MTDKAQKRAVKRYEGNEEQIQANEVHNIMSRPQGRSFIYMLLEQFDTEGTPFHQDPHITAYRCGLQQAGQYIRGLVVTHAPEQYVQMLQERKELDERTADRDDERSADYDG